MIIPQHAVVLCDTLSLLPLVKRVASGFNVTLVIRSLWSVDHILLQALGDLVPGQPLLLSTAPLVVTCLPKEAQVAVIEPVTLLVGFVLRLTWCYSVFVVVG